MGYLTMKRKLSDRFRELSESFWGSFCGVVFFILIIGGSDDPYAVIWFPALCLVLGILFGIVRKILKDRERSEDPLHTWR